MTNCCVDGCIVPSDDEDIAFYQFPLSRVLKRKWVTAINSSSKVKVSSMVCSQHFTDEDYELVRGKKRLRGQVIPTRLLHQNKKIESKPDDSKNDDNTEILNDDTSQKTDQDNAQNATESTSSISYIDKSNSENDAKYDDVNTSRVDSVIDAAKCDSQSVFINGSQSDSIENDSQSDAKKTDQNESVCDSSIDANKVASKSDQGTKSNSSNHHVRNGSHQTQDLDLMKGSEDIEDILTNYQIQTKPQASIEPMFPEQDDDCCQLIEPAPPVFIEIDVGKDPQNSSNAETSDCLMLLESVQCEVDPSTLMLPEYESHGDERAEVPSEQKNDAISLLTSSDEDEVIIQEPHIDTVEVSDEDEDDVPLLSLVKPDKKSTKPINFQDIMWGIMEYFCYKCKFASMSKGEYQRHMKDHSLAIRICEICNYTTASNLQFERHKKKHKDDKRFKCHLCNYQARHNMSLVYHLKSHEVTQLKRVKKGFKCQKCNFVSDNKMKVLKHVRLCMSVKRYSCDSGNCEYETSSASNLKRHKAKKHQDEEFVVE